MKLLNRFIKYEKSCIGMDIGSYAVKTVKLFREKDNFKIQSIGYVRVKKPFSRDNMVEAVKESAAKAGVLNREVNIAVSSPSVIVRFIELPRMTADELRNAVSFEAEKYIPFSVNEVILDHQLLIPRLKDNKMLVLLAAAKKDLVAERLNLAGEAGLSVGLLNVASFADVNAFFMTAGRKKNETSALIDIGSKATDINIIADDILYFARSVQLGGDNITKALSELYSIDFEKAESLKLNPGNKTTEICEKIRSIFQNIIDEIQLSFSYYENQSGRAVEKVYVTGGGAKALNFCALLGENLSAGMTVWDPANFMELNSSIDTQLFNSIKNQLGVSIGLALR
ncbi:MAG: type IV pilus assembly protein PilM [Candidatus Omnitrophota bacterium]|nr:type IV pilus assembly protein PilM [Candidatus Omnitrophota bacterium]